MHAHNGSNEVAEWKIAHLLNYKVPIPDVGALLRFRHHRERAPSIDTERLNWRRVSAATDTRMDKNSARAPLWPRGRGLSLSLSFDTIHYFRGGGVSVCVFHYEKAGHFRHNKQQSDFIALLPSMHFYSCVCRSWKMHAPRERSGVLVCEGPKQPSVATTRFWNAKFLNAHFGYAIGAQTARQLMALGLNNKIYLDVNKGA